MTTITIKQVYEYPKEGGKNPYENVAKDFSRAIYDNPEGHNYHLPYSIQGWNNDEQKFNEFTVCYLGFLCKDKETSEVTPGITNEQVFTMMLDRFTHLNNSFPCKENEEVIQHLEAILKVCMKRQADRYEREVLGKHEL